MQWFLTLFCSSSLPLGQRVLDLFFVHGWTVRWMAEARIARSRCGVVGWGAVGHCIVLLRFSK